MRRTGLLPTWPPMRGESLSQQVPPPSNSSGDIWTVLNIHLNRYGLFVYSLRSSLAHRLWKLRKKSEFISSESSLCPSVRSTLNQNRKWAISANFSSYLFVCLFIYFPPGNEVLLWCIAPNLAVRSSRTCSASRDMHGAVKKCSLQARVGTECTKIKTPVMLCSIQMHCLVVLIENELLCFHSFVVSRKLEKLFSETTLTFQKIVRENIPVKLCLYLTSMSAVWNWQHALNAFG